MKFKILPSLLFLFCILLSLRGFSQMTVVNASIIGDSDIFNRSQQEIKLTQDPRLNQVPVERIIVANKVRTQLLNSQPSSTRPPSGKSADKPVANPTVINTLKWNERGPTNVGGRTRGLMFDLGDQLNGYKKVFAGGVGGGIWYTKDITATPVSWTKVNDFFSNIAISSIIQNPINPLVIYASTGEGFGVYTSGLGVWKTADGGNTWAQLPSTSSFSYINSMVVDRSGNLYIAAENSGIQKSSDGGNTFSQVLGAPVFGDGGDGADLELAANGDIYAATGDFSTGEVFISPAAGNDTQQGNSGTWTNITPNTTGVLTTASTNWWRIKLACAPSDASTVYGLFNKSNQDAVTSIQRYSRTTNTWSVATVPDESFSNDQGWYALAIAVDQNDANTLLAGSLDMQKSADGGMTWKQLTHWDYDETNPLYLHADHHSYVYAPGSSSRAITGTDGGVSYTSTINTTIPSFITQNNGYNVTQFYSVALHPTNVNYALAGAQDNGTQQFTMPGLAATSAASDGDGADTFIDQLNPQIQITSYTYNQHWVSVDGGTTFNEVFINTNGSFINPSDYDSKYQTLYSGNLPGTYLRWSQVALASVKTGVSVPVPAFNGASVTHVTVSPVTSNRVYFGLNNGTVVVVNNANAASGQTSIVLNPNSASYASETSVSSISVDPAAEGHLLVTYSNYGVNHIFETQNAFTSSPVWTADDGNLPDLPVRWAMFYPGDSSMAVIATELGVWTTNSLNSKSTSWLPTNTGLANTRVDMLKYRALDKTLAAASYGRGMFTTTLPVTGKPPQTITFAATSSATYGCADFQAGATSTNSTIPITYTSSNPAVCTVSTVGLIHVITLGSSTITASQNGNLIYQAAIPQTQLLTVNPAPLTITALDETKYFGDTIPVLKISYTGFVRGDTTTALTAQAKAATTATVSSPVGEYAVTVSGAAGPNYTIIYGSGMLSVAPAPAPTIISLSATTARSGTTIMIKGTYLFGASALTFGGLPVSSYTVISESSISAVLGTGFSGTVAATTPTGTGTISGFIFVPVPVITSASVPILLNASSLVLNATTTTTGSSGSGGGAGSSSSTPAWSYQWIKDGLTLDGAVNATYTATEAGSYLVEIELNSVSQPSNSFTVQGLNGSLLSNFSVVTTPLICKGSTDGSIRVTAAQNMPYTATITAGQVSTIYPFTSSLLIPKLGTGTYTICITIAGLPAYQQCYTSAIADYQDLTLSTSTNNITKELTLTLGGSSAYVLDFNGVTSSTSSSVVVLPLVPGKNTLVASTGQICQGIITRTCTSSNNMFAFPNPFTSTVNIDLGKVSVLNANVTLYTAEGIAIFSGSYANVSGILSFTPQGLITGIYMLKLVTDGNETVFNVMKK